MPPSRRKGASKAAAAAAACKKWKVGDLVLAKLKGFPAWPATVSEPQKWGYSTDWKKVLVYFFGTQQIAFCNPADVEAFTEEKKESLLIKRQGKGADFVRAVQEIIDSYEKSKKQDQVDAINSGDEVTLTNAGNAVDSSANVGLKVQTETPEATLDSQSNTSYSARENLEPIPPVEDAPAATQINALHDEETLFDKRKNDLVVKKEPLIATYSSRKRSVGLRSQSRVTQRMALSVRRSRSSSRYQNFVQLCNADGKCVRDIETNVVQDVCSRMNKRNRKSPDASDLHAEDSIACISNSSMEDDGSEIATVDSDTFSLNESNTIDSGCKLENSETVVECLEGDVELRKGLDLQIKAVVIKKKRKPNRKRVTNDAARSTAGLDREEGGVHNSDQNSQNACEKLNEKCSKEDGDEHLPLVKRARVRMGKISAVDEQNSSRTEDEPLKDVAVNLSDQISTPLESDSGNAANRNFLLLKGASDNVSPSKGCSQFSENMHQLKTVKRNQSFGCSADGEAALPPSKRLHRALEAMSANAAEEGQPCNETFAAAQIFSNGSCDSSMRRCTHIAMESKAENGLRLQCVDSLGNNASQVGASGFSTSLNPIISEELIKSPPGIDICNQPIKNSRNQEHEFCKDVLAEAMEFNDGKDRSGSSFGAHTTRTAAQTQSPGYLSPNLDIRMTSLRSGQGSLDQSTSSKEEGNTENGDLNNYRSDNGDKDLDASEHTGMSPDPGSRDNGIDKILPQNSTGLLQYCAEGVGCENVEHLNPEIDDNGRVNCQVSSKCEVVKEVEHKQMQNSASVASDEVDMCDRDGLAVRPSPSPTHGVESPARMSPPDSSNCHTSTSDTVADEEGKDKSVAIQRPRFVGKRNNYEEAHAALSSYEAILGTLTRTKESIGRATRMAIDCAKKFGNGSKVVEILARTLESESNLHRRVDLFFLVDSITQCARGLKGDDGGIYPSAIQELLPRLLLAAAPPGHTAPENRRQCLKVLRLWLERRILPESIIRHHMRELDPFSGSSSGAFSRRSSRTERPLDDPVRDMGGMLVDEYGSNSSFQIPGFCMPRMLKDEDEGSDSDDESFEAVTPEHNIKTPEDWEAVPAIDKHRHILEDVDGELEMEDVAPSYEVDMNSNSSVAGVNSAQTLPDRFDRHLPLPFAPPLPQDVPPSSPPPPPLPPPCAMSNPYPNGSDSKIYTSTHTMQGNLQQPVAHQSVAPSINPTISDAVRYHVPECRDVQMQKHDSATFSSIPVPPVNSVQQSDGAPFHKKTFPPLPPHPAPSNQFSYVRSNQHVKSRREAPPPRYSNRSHFVHNMDNGNFYNNHDRMKPAPYEFRERFPAPPCSGPRYPGKPEVSYAPPYVGPPRGPMRLPNQGWTFPARTMNHRNYIPFRPPPEGPIPVANRAPGFWRPR